MLSEQSDDRSHRGGFARADITPAGRRGVHRPDVRGGDITNVDEPPREADDARIRALEQVDEDLIRRVEPGDERGADDQKGIDRNQVEPRPPLLDEIPRGPLGERLRKIVRIALER